MGKRDNEKLGEYLLDRVRGEQTTRLPSHPEAAELAAAADAAAHGYEQLDIVGDELGSKYALLRHIDRDMAIREDRRRSWVRSFVAATACAVVFAGVVLAAYIFGVQQGAQIAGRISEPTLVPVNVSPVGPTNVDVKPYPSQDTTPVAGPEPLPQHYGDLEASIEARITSSRAMAIRNGTPEADANAQTDHLRTAKDLLMGAHAFYDLNQRIGALGLVVDHLAKMESKFPKNELTVFGLGWGAGIARNEMARLDRAEELYADLGRVCDGIVKSREGSGLDQSYISMVRDDASLNYGIVKDLRQRGAGVFTFQSADERGMPPGSPSQ